MSEHTGFKVQEVGVRVAGFPVFDTESRSSLHASLAQDVSIYLNIFFWQNHSI